MALLDFLKKKETPLEKTVEDKTEKKPEKKEIEKKEKKLPSVKPAPKKKYGPFLNVLRAAHVSEKATDLVKNNQYTFRVLAESNKNQIKRSVENIYGVDVLQVKVIKIPRKKKMRGRTVGWKKGYKKAIVKIKEGQKIELLPR